MKKTAVLGMSLVAVVMVAYPVSANPHRSHYHQRLRPHSDDERSHITCEMVRSYVAQVGLEQAKAIAAAAGMTANDERRARQCLAKKV